MKKIFLFAAVFKLFGFLGVAQTIDQAKKRYLLQQAGNGQVCATVNYYKGKRLA